MREKNLLSYNFTIRIKIENFALFFFQQRKYIYISLVRSFLNTEFDLNFEKLNFHFKTRELTELCVCVFLIFKRKIYRYYQFNNNFIFFKPCEHMNLAIYIRRTKIKERNSQYTQKISLQKQDGLT